MKMSLHDSMLKCIFNAYYTQNPKISNYKAVSLTGNGFY